MSQMKIKKEDPTIIIIEKIIEETPTKDLNVLTVKKIAQYLSLSENLVTKKYKRKRNINLSKLIFCKRMQKAFFLLKNKSELSIEEISNVVGYDDTEYFGKITKRIFGKTPSEIKNKNKKN